MSKLLILLVFLFTITFGCTSFFDEEYTDMERELALKVEYMKCNGKYKEYSTDEAFQNYMKTWGLKKV